MRPRYLLDTNICIYALSGRYPEVRKYLDSRPPGEAIISTIVLGELEYGIAKSKHPHDAHQRLAAFINLIAVHPLPLEAGRHYGEIRAELESQGTPIGANDLWIAAHARAAELTLITHNVNEFNRVPKLHVEDWSETKIRK